jgi:hypothetical protein
VTQITMPDLSTVLARPAIWYPGQSQADWEEEIEVMLEVSNAVALFTSGRIDAVEYLDRVDAIGIDPLSIYEVVDGPSA